jgi:hypothetical protein
MQGLWYGDRRDRVKWGALAHLASRFHLVSIVQVAYLRDGLDRFLTTDLPEPERINDAVWTHFADLAAIEHLAADLGVQTIKVHVDTFDPKKRQDYLDGLLKAAAISPRPRLLFLDPDTGIQPGKLTPEHASLREITSVWRALDVGEVLALYQHAPHQADWVEQSINRMKSACEDAAVHAIRGTVARDVAVLWTRKEHTRSK